MGTRKVHMFKKWTLCVKKRGIFVNKKGTKSWIIEQGHMRGRKGHICEQNGTFENRITKRHMWVAGGSHWDKKALSPFFSF